MSFFGPRDRNRAARRLKMLSSWARRVLGVDEKDKPSSARASEPPKLPVTSRALRVDGNDVNESDKGSDASELSPLRGAETPGSRRHGTECDPCAWYWKPQGCQRGSECGYCHLCPDGEVKLRKKAKLAAMRGATPSSTTPLSPTKGQIDDIDIEVPDRLPSMSVGAALHGTGECKPCAWFWKPKGCQNGEECRHCHLCPQGEIRQRKKMKDRSARNGGYSEEGILSMPMEPLKVELPGVTQEFDALQVGALEEPQKVSPSPTSNLEPQKVSPSPTPNLGDSADIAPPPGLVVLKRQDSLEQEIASSPLALSLAQLLDEDDAKLETDSFMMGTEGVDAVAHVFPSEGSKLHGSGFCRPCAWFWKPKGCENGNECRHCHLCPQEEIKNRRKMKQTMQNDQGSPMMWGATWTPLSAIDSLVTQTPASMFPGREFSDPTLLTPLDPGTSTMQSSTYDYDQWDAFGAPSPVALESPKLSIALASCLPVPSVGSALHESGKCKPCAWFHKPAGCSNGDSCAHCHLCPEDEIRNRKKAKEAALRAGALEPKRDADSRNPRTVRIAPLLAE
eukprot:Skav200652  [mRNA]  locus=scaffold2539:141299:142990:+ [translate_table: standard]